ncbi:hypothetical protein QOT17_007838 [Balamuthia mandrillaris]
MVLLKLFDRSAGHPSPSHCKPPLENLGDTNNCAFKCPLPANTEDQYDSVQTLQLSWFSWVRRAFGSHSILRPPQQPANSILMAAHAKFVGMIHPKFVGYDNTWCGFDSAFLVPDSKAAGGTLVITFRMEDLSVKSGL